MKTLLFAAALLLGLARADAANFRLDGDLSWEITEPRLTFNLVGNLVDLTEGTSGTIKLVLWMSPQPYPSAGYNIGEYSLGEISGGFQFSDFQGRTACDIPALTGAYHFTVLVLEYTTSGWRNRLIVPAGNATLIKGDFITQPKWKISTKKVTSPPAALAAGDLVTLKVKATSLLNLLPIASQLRTTLAVKSLDRLTATSSGSKRTPKYSYRIVQPTFNKVKVKVGQLTLEYPASGKFPKATEIVTLYFQGTTSGTYQSVRTSSGTTETTWGGFTF